MDMMQHAENLKQIIKQNGFKQDEFKKQVKRALDDMVRAWTNVPMIRAKFALPSVIVGVNDWLSQHAISLPKERATIIQSQSRWIVRSRVKKGIQHIVDTVAKIYEQEKNKIMELTVESCREWLTQIFKENNLNT